MACPRGGRRGMMVDGLVIFEALHLHVARRSLGARSPAFPARTQCRIDQPLNLYPPGTISERARATALSRRQVELDPLPDGRIRIRCVGRRHALPHGACATECVAEAGDTLASPDGCGQHESHELHWRDSGVPRLGVSRRALRRLPSPPDRRFDTSASRRTCAWPSRSCGNAVRGRSQLGALPR
jgi:hypothetical protein